MAICKEGKIEVLYLRIELQAADALEPFKKYPLMLFIKHLRICFMRGDCYRTSQTWNLRV